MARKVRLVDAQRTQTVVLNNLKWTRTSMLYGQQRRKEKSINQYMGKQALSNTVDPATQLKGAQHAGRDVKNAAR